MAPAAAWADSPAATPISAPLPGGNAYLYVAGGCLALAIVLLIYRSRRRLKMNTKKK
ncbi:MAG: hypothetical protein PHO66_06295 [Eubacteriales bacterium]|nr:hypothetical protein [Eubacteriales bacterium]